MYAIKSAIRTYTINQEVTKIGRHISNDIVIEDLRVSRFHSQIIIDNGRIFLKDISTINGTFIQSHRLLPDRDVLLKAGDSIGIGCKAEKNGTCTLIFEKLASPTANEPPQREENEVVSTTNDYDPVQSGKIPSENCECDDDPELLSILEPNVALQPNVVQQPKTGPLRKPPTTSAPPIVSQPSSRLSETTSSIALAQVKREPVVCSTVDTVDPATMSRAKGDDTGSQHPAPAPSQLANLCLKQPPLDDDDDVVLSAGQDNIDGRQPSNLNDAQRNLLQARLFDVGANSRNSEEDVKQVVRNLFEQFFTEKVSASDILPRLLSRSNRLSMEPQESQSADNSSSGGSSNAIASTDAGSKRVPDGIPVASVAPSVRLDENVVVKPEILSDNHAPVPPPITPFQNTLVKVDLSGSEDDVAGENATAVSSSAMPPLRNRRRPTLKSTQPIDVDSDLLVTGEGDESAESAKRGSRDERRGTTKPAPEKLPYSENVINLCDVPSNSPEDVIMISDDESGGPSHQQKKRRKTIDPNTIVIDEETPSVEVIATEGEELRPPANLIPADALKTDPVFELLVEELEPTIEVPESPTNDFKSDAPQASVSFADELSSFIDLSEDRKPLLPVVKCEFFVPPTSSRHQCNYSNLDDIIALDSDDEDFPSSQMNMTLIEDVSDYSSSFQRMFDDQEEFVKQEPQMQQCNEWFDDTLSQAGDDMVEGRRGSWIRSCTTDSDASPTYEQPDAYKAPATLADVNEEVAVVDGAEMMEVVASTSFAAPPENHAVASATISSSKYPLKEGIKFTDAKPLYRRKKHKEVRDEDERSKEKAGSIYDFDECMLGADDAYRPPRTGHGVKEAAKKKFRAADSTPSDKQQQAHRKRKSDSLSMSVQEKKMIKMKRKEKLKEITSTTSSKGDVDRHLAYRAEAKPVVKVTSKNRASYLMDTLIRPPSVPKREKPAKESAADGKKSNAGPSTDAAQRLAAFKEKPATSTTTSVASCNSNDEKLARRIYNAYCQPDGHNVTAYGPILPTEADNIVVTPPSGEGVAGKLPPADADGGWKGTDAAKESNFTKNESAASTTTQPKVRKDYSKLGLIKKASSSALGASATRLTTGKPLKSNLKKPDISHGPPNIYSLSKTKKKVRFRKEHEFRIITTDDPTERRNNGIFAPAYKLNESLIRESMFEFETAMAKVCSWNVKWLEEQQKYRDPPPLYPECDELASNCLLLVGKYKEQLKLLMFCSLWKAMFKSWNKPDNNFFPHTQYINEKKSLSTLIIDSVDTSKTDKKLWTIFATRTMSCSESDSDMSNGQIVILNFPVIQSTSGAPRKTMVFGYVANIMTMNNSDNMTVTQKMSLKVFAKPFQIVLGEAKLKVLSYLKTFLKPFQALAMVTRSPLTDFIIDPEKKFFFDQIFDASGDWFYDKFLDCSQRKAVATGLNCIYSPEPSLCVVDGASGTGKSQVIVSLMRELFLKGNRNRFPNDLKVLIVAANDIIADDLSYRLEAHNKKEKCLNFLRYGNCKGMHAAMKDCTLDKKIQDLLNEEAGHNLVNMEEEKNNLKAKIHSIKLVLDSSSAKPEKINEAKLKLTNNEKEWNDMVGENSRVIEQLKTQIAKEISIESADVVVTSIYSCWSSNFENDFVPTHHNKGDFHKFTVCIIDDASLVNETGMLLPMMLMVRSLILIGDTRNQLALNHIKSPFYRLFNECVRKAPNALAILNCQYRVPPLIMQWISEFYDIKCKPKSVSAPKLRLKTFFLFDVPFPASDELSFRYENQAYYCRMLVETLNQVENTNSKIGVIVANSLQKDIIKSAKGLFEGGRKVIVDTLEEFSGRELGVVILCLPYQCYQYGSWLYLAVTRAKYSLFVCGDLAHLQSQDSVRSLTQFAKNRNLFSQRDPAETNVPANLFLAT